jgi:hypothetical protein
MTLRMNGREEITRAAQCGDECEFVVRIQESTSFVVVCAK